MQQRKGHQGGSAGGTPQLCPPLRLFATPARQSRCCASWQHSCAASRTCPLTQVSLLVNLSHRQFKQGNTLAKVQGSLFCRALFTHLVIDNISSKKVCKSGIAGRHCVTGLQRHSNSSTVGLCCFRIAHVVPVSGLCCRQHHMYATLAHACQIWLFPNHAATSNAPAVSGAAYLETCCLFPVIYISTA